MTDTSADRSFHDPDPTLDAPVGAAWFQALNKIAFDILVGAETADEARTALNLYTTEEVDAAIAALGDIDPSSYLLVDGTRALTGVQAYASHPTFTAIEQLVDKGYVDDAISGAQGITSHSALDNLDDPADHPWASLVDGTRAFTDKVAYSAHPTFDADEQLIDKKYADDTFLTTVLAASTYLSISDASDTYLTILSVPVTESGTSFTLGSAHNGQVVFVDNAADVTVTCPSTGNAAGFNCALIPINTGRILFDDDGGASTLQKPETSNLRSGEREQPIFVHQSSVGTYRLSGGLEDASIKKMQMMICDASVAVAATDGFNGNFAIIPDEYDGMNLVDVSIYHRDAGVGDTTYQVRRIRGGTPVNMLSTVVKVEDGEDNSLTATTQPAIDLSNDDVAEADMIIIDPKTVGSTPPNGSVVILEFRRPAS